MIHEPERFHSAQARVSKAGRLEQEQLSDILAGSVRFGFEKRGDNLDFFPSPSPRRLSQRSRGGHRPMVAVGIMGRNGNNRLGVAEV
jgi:hypothetical protein